MTFNSTSRRGWGKEVGAEKDSDRPQAKTFKIWCEFHVQKQ